MHNITTNDERPPMDTRKLEIALNASIYGIIEMLERGVKGKDTE